MQNRLGRTIQSLLLSVLVLAWGTVPPGITHCHAGGGDAAHRHGNRQEVVQEHSHPHHHGADGEHDEHRPKSDVSMLSNSIVHLHQWWFGIEFSLPASDGPVDSDNNGDSEPTAIARAMDEILLVTEADESLGRATQAVARTSCLDIASDLKPMLRTWVTASFPLCDSARLERTGVLLC